MSEPLEVEYFNWLRAKVLPTNTNTYYDLMRILYTTEFVWFISGDRNRKEDGLELRCYFLNETRREKDLTWWNEPCSVLEFLIALAQRASFQTDIPARDWFWTFLTNLELDEFRQVSSSDQSIVEEILYTFVQRMYEPNGRGGIFPMQYTENDQREIEIWYQLAEYIDDQGLI